MDVRDAFLRRDFQRLADSIDTGLQDPETSRALIVFNHSMEAISGSVSFYVDMRWRVGRPLPPLRVIHLESGRLRRHAIFDMQLSTEVPEEAYGRLRFQLRFEVAIVPARGWDTYIAQYIDEDIESPTESLMTHIGADRYLVAETLRRIGEVPPRGWIDD